MTDRENVIKESEEAIDILAKAEEPTFWLDFVRCAFENALAMLKEQEPVKPDEQGDGSFACGNCGETVGWEEMNCGGLSMVKYKYCPECGKVVKWDD